MTVRNNRCISVLKLYLFVFVFIPIALHWNFTLYCFYVISQYLSFYLEVMDNLWAWIIQDLVRS